MTGETNFKQDMESMRGKAEQQGTAQPGLRDAAKDIKKVRATEPSMDALANTPLYVENMGRAGLCHYASLEQGTS